MKASLASVSDEGWEHVPDQLQTPLFSRAGERGGLRH